MRVPIARSASTSLNQLIQSALCKLLFEVLKARNHFGIMALDYSQHHDPDLHTDYQYD
jgi:hypothetical protein